MGDLSFWVFRCFFKVLAFRMCGRFSFVYLINFFSGDFGVSYFFCIFLVIRLESGVVYRMEFGVSIDFS